MIAFSPLASSGAVGGIFGKVWSTMVAYERDPYSGVAILARTVTTNIRMKAKEAMKINGGSELDIIIIITIITLNNNATFNFPVKNTLGVTNSSIGSTGSTSIVVTTPVKGGGGGSAGRRTPSPDLGGSGDNLRTSGSGSVSGLATNSILPLIGTKYIEWCWDRFARPSVPGSMVLGAPLTCCPTAPPPIDPHDPVQHTREWWYARNAAIRRECLRRPKSFPGKIDEQMFSSRNVHSSHGSSPSSAASSPSFSFNSSPSLVKLHDYEKLLLSSEGSIFTLYDLGNTKRCKLV